MAASVPDRRGVEINLTGITRLLYTFVDEDVMSIEQLEREAENAAAASQHAFRVTDGALYARIRRVMGTLLGVAPSEAETDVPS